MADEIQQLIDSVLGPAPKEPEVMQAGLAQYATHDQEKEIKSFAKDLARRQSLDKSIRDVSFIEANKAPDGVPFIPETGAPAALRTILGAEDDPKKRLLFLNAIDPENDKRGVVTQNEPTPYPMGDMGASAMPFGEGIAHSGQRAADYGIVGARPATDGRLILRVRGDDGQIYDTLEKGLGLNAGDAAGLVSDVPQAAANVYIAAQTGGATLPMQIAAMTGANAAMTTGKELLTREAMGTGQDPASTAKDVLTGAAFDVGVPLVPAAAKRWFLGPITAPLARDAGNAYRSRLQEAIKRLGEETGVVYKPSAAEATGNRLLARMETFTQNTEQAPFVGDALSKAAYERDAQFSRIIDNVLDIQKSGPVPTQGTIGERVGDVLSNELTATNAGIQASREEARVAAEAGIDAAVAGAQGTTLSTAGKSAREGVLAKLQAFKDQNAANYGAAYSLPGAQEPLFSAKPILNALKSVENSQVKGKSGDPLLVEAGLKKFLGLQDELPEKMALQDLVNLRGKINDALESVNGEMLQGVGAKNLKTIAGSIGSSIEQGLKALPDGELKAAFESAQKFYRENFKKFSMDELEGKGVADLAGARVADEDVVSRIFSGGQVSELRNLKAVLGAESTEYKNVLRAGFNEMVDRSRSADILGRIDPVALHQQVRNMGPEMAQEVFGKNMAGFLDELQTLKLLKTDRIDPAALEYVLASGSKSEATAKLKLVTEMERARDAFFESNTVKPLLAGATDPSTIDADQLVSRFITRSSPENIKEVVRRISSSPDTLYDVRRKVMEETLNAASHLPTAEGLAKGEVARRVKGTELSKFIGERKDQLQAVLTPNQWQNLQDVLQIALAKDTKSEVGKAAGQLVSTSAVAGMMKAKAGVISDTITFKIWSMFLSHPIVEDIATGSAQTMRGRAFPAFAQAMQKNQTPVTRRIIFSSPMLIRALTEDLKGKGNALTPEEEAAVGEMLRQETAGEGSQVNWNSVIDQVLADDVN